MANTAQIQVFGNGGNDRPSASPMAPCPSVIDAGPGNDVGPDVACLDARNDTFVWNPGDGSDVIESGSQDGMDFRGAERSEAIDVSANGP